MKTICTGSFFVASACVCYVKNIKLFYIVEENSFTLHVRFNVYLLVARYKNKKREQFWPSKCNKLAVEKKNDWNSSIQ